MAFVSISLSEKIEIPDQIDVDQCIFTCQDGQILMSKTLLKASSEHWNQYFGVNYGITRQPLPLLTLSTAQHIKTLLSIGHLILPTHETTRFLLGLDAMELRPKMIFKSLTRPRTSAFPFTTESQLVEDETMDLQIDLESPLEDTSPPQGSSSRTVTIVIPETSTRPKVSTIMQRTEQGKYFCVVCEQIYSQRGHYYVHFPGNFKCPYCKVHFKRSDNMHAHKRSAHVKELVS